MRASLSFPHSLQSPQRPERHMRLAGAPAPGMRRCGLHYRISMSAVRSRGRGTGREEAVSSYNQLSPTNMHRKNKVLCICDGAIMICYARFRLCLASPCSRHRRRHRRRIASQVFLSAPLVAICRFTPALLFTNKTLLSSSACLPVHLPVSVYLHLDRRQAQGVHRYGGSA